MNALRVLSVAIALACAPVASAQDATQHAAPVIDAALCGLYHLDGVMETGSGLAMVENGNFRWYFTYGALDLVAQGEWKREGDLVVLEVLDMPVPYQIPEMRFDRMTLRIDGSDLVPRWPWDMDDFRKNEERGVYVREE